MRKDRQNEVRMQGEVLQSWQVQADCRLPHQSSGVFSSLSRFVSTLKFKARRRLLFNVVSGQRGGRLGKQCCSLIRACHQTMPIDQLSATAVMSLRPSELFSKWFHVGFSLCLCFLSNCFLLPLRGQSRCSTTSNSRQPQVVTGAVAVTVSASCSWISFEFTI